MGLKENNDETADKNVRNMTQIDLYSKDGFQAVLITSINLERQIQIWRENEIAKAVKMITNVILSSC